MLIPQDIITTYLHVFTYHLRAPQLWNFYNVFMILVILPQKMGEAQLLRYSFF